MGHAWFSQENWGLAIHAFLHAVHDNLVAVVCEAGYRTLAMPTLCKRGHLDTPRAIETGRWSPQHLASPHERLCVCARRIGGRHGRHGDGR
eukprot:4138254-Prymnesium_polylepis.1